MGLNLPWSPVRLHLNHWCFGVGGWLALSALACGSGVIAPPDAPGFDPEGQTKCSVAKSQTKPLIVEWPSADRMALETQLKGGVVPVRYTGCEMEVLSHCTAPGSYKYTSATRQDDVLRIRNEDELYASIPVYAASFEGALSTSGQLTVSMSMVGRFLSDRALFHVNDLDGACQGATHVITATTVGAFEFYSGADAEVGAGVSAGGAKVGARQLAAKETINKAGAAAACGGATSKDDQPPSGCGALIRIEVVPLDGVVQPTEAVASGPSDSPGMDEAPADSQSQPTGGRCDPNRLNKSCKREKDCCPGEFCDDPCNMNSSWSLEARKVIAQQPCPDPTCRTKAGPHCGSNRTKRNCSSNSDCCPDEHCYDPCNASLAPLTPTPHLLAEAAESCSERSFCRR